MSIVWVKLYDEGKDDAVGQPIFIKIESLDPPIIGALAKAAKAELKKELDHAGLTEIFVYPPGTEPPFSQDKALKAWDPIPSNSSGPQPLIVVAPQQQEDGEKHFSFFFICSLLNLFKSSLANN